MSSSIPTSRGLDAPKSKGRRTYRHLSLGEEENDDDPLVQRDEDQGGNEPRLPRHDDDDDDDEDGHCITMDDAIERLGVGPFQYRVLVCSGLCFAADGMQIVLLSFLTLVLQKEWSLSDEATAALTSTLFAGAMLGTLVLGPLADTRGRRPVFLLAAAVISGFGFLLAVVNHYVAVAVAIFGVGIGIGGLTVPFDILAEFLPAEHRGTHLLLIEYFWTVGCLYVVGVAYVTLHYLGTWRGFVALSALPSLAALIAGYLYVPESARWLHSQGKTDEALEILKLAAGENGCDVHFLYPDQIVLQPEEDEVESTCTDLFLPKWRGITLRLWGAWMGFAFGYYGAIMATTRVFSTSSDSSDSTEDFDYGAIFISSFAEVVGTTLVILVIDRWGRIPLQVVSYSVAGIALALLCMLAGGSSSFSSARLPLVSLGFTTRVFEMAATCVTWVSTAEVLSTDIRTTGHSSANAMARIGAFFSPFLVEGSTPLPRIGLIMLFVHLFTAACTSGLPETMGRAMGAAEPNSVGDEHELVPASEDGDNAELSGRGVSVNTDTEDTAELT